MKTYSIGAYVNIIDRSTGQPIVLSIAHSLAENRIS